MGSKLWSSACLWQKSLQPAILAREQPHGSFCPPIQQKFQTTSSNAAHSSQPHHLHDCWWESKEFVHSQTCCQHGLSSIPNHHGNTGHTWFWHGCCCWHFPRCAKSLQPKEPTSLLKMLLATNLVQLQIHQDLKAFPSQGLKLQSTQTIRNCSSSESILQFFLASCSFSPYKRYWEYIGAWTAFGESAEANGASWWASNPSQHAASSCFLLLPEVAREPLYHAKWLEASPWGTGLTKRPPLLLCMHWLGDTPLSYSVQQCCIKSKVHWQWQWFSCASCPWPIFCSETRVPS